MAPFLFRLLLAKPPVQFCGTTSVATGALFWTNETHYPYVYKYHRNAGWYWYVEGGSPGNREFIRYADGLLFTEDEWNE